MRKRRRSEGLINRENKKIKDSTGNTAERIQTKRTPKYIESVIVLVSLSVIVYSFYKKRE